MGKVAGEKYLFQQQGTATAVRPMRGRGRERERERERERDLWLRGVQKKKKKNTLFRHVSLRS